MHSTPKVKVDNKSTAQKSRGEQANGNKFALSLPDVDDIVLHAFLSVGPSKAGAPIDWPNLESYSRLTSANLSPWESECVISMSRQYCIWLRKGEEQHCASPWGDGDIKADETSESVNSAFKSLRSHALSQSKKRSQ